jgi:transglutaminase-like putative cysteine protease
MRRLVDAAVRQADFLLWAREQVRRMGTDLRDPRAIANAIRLYVATRLAFVRDPIGFESLTPPLKHMLALDRYRVVGGDCDDAATLAAALGRALGLRAAFTVEAFDWGKGPSPFQHVYATLLPPAGQGSWSVKVDTTRDPQGLPPKVQRSKTVLV